MLRRTLVRNSDRAETADCQASMARITSEARGRLPAHLGLTRWESVRSPAKTALLAHAAGAVGLGRGFAMHKALDQAGGRLRAGLLRVGGELRTRSLRFITSAPGAISGCWMLILKRALTGLIMLP
jgi:hypothetical protein